MPTPIHARSLLARLASGGTGSVPDWLEQCVAQAISLYDDHRLHAPASLLASSHKNGIDYLVQAPVLALNIASRPILDRSASRRRVAERFGATVAGSPRLREVMRAQGLPTQLRKLGGRALRREHHVILPALARLAPEVLAQSIPDDVLHQRGWLNELTRWKRGLITSTDKHDEIVAWAAAYARDVSPARSNALITYLGQNADSFDPAQSFSAVLGEATRWHAVHNAPERHLLRRKIDLDRAADYSGFPSAFTVDGLEIVGLDTGRKLAAEGEALAHCAVQYHRLVMSEACWLFSVRRNGESLATFELRVSARSRPGRRCYTMIQIKGYENTKACPEAVSAALTFLSYVNAPPPPQLEMF